MDQIKMSNSVNSTWTMVGVDRDNKIFFIEDISHLTNTKSITNDAENVLKHFQDAVGTSWRVVYRDTDNEWWEIIAEDHPWEGIEVRFEKWHGIMWDKLRGNV